MVCLQYVETRKCGAIEFLTFAWIVFSLQLSIAILIKKTQLALFYTLSASVWFTQTFDDVSIKRRNDSWFAYSWLWGLLTCTFTTMYLLLFCIFHQILWNNSNPYIRGIVLNKSLQVNITTLILLSNCLKNA